MRTIGVLGGMGPAATADFFTRLVRAVPGTRDQDHPPILVNSASQIPDRTSHLLDGGADPTPALQEAARVLQRAGADLIVIACNSAHAYLPAIRDAVDVPVLDMIRIAARRARKMLGAGAAVAVLAATGTARLGLYEAALLEVGLRPLQPDYPEQEGVMSAVRGVKAGGGEQMHLVRPALSQLIERGATGVILGCTELPLAVRMSEIPVPVIDAADAVIAAALQEAMAPLPSL